MEINVKMEGFVSIELKRGKAFDQFCEQHFDNYDPDRFEAIVVRGYCKKELILTVYALDKSRQEGTNYDMERLPVKKFKSTTISFADIIPYLEEFNFAVGADNYAVNEMQVINK